MSTISLRLPDSLHKKVKELAKEDHISINQFISSSVAEKISALETQDYLKHRAEKGSISKFKEVLNKVPDVEPEEYDRL